MLQAMPSVRALEERTVLPPIADLTVSPCGRKPRPDRGVHFFNCNTKVSAKADLSPSALSA